MADILHLYRHGRQYYYDRKVPSDLRPFMPEPHTGKARYRVRLGTTDLVEAQRAKAIHGAQYQLALEKARKAKEGKGEDDTTRQIDALALELHALEQGEPEEAALLPDEAIEQAVAMVPPSLRQRFWKVKNEGKAPTPITDKLEEWIAHTDEIGERTKLERRTAIKDFTKWHKGGLEEVTRETAKDYRKYLQTKIIASTQRPMAPATINKRLQALSLYWQYLEEDKVISDGAVWKGLQKKKGRRANPDELERTFTEDEVKTLFSGKPKLRMLDAMTIAFFTGAREGEIGNMKVSHVDLGKKTVKVPGTKGENAPRLGDMETSIEVGEAMRRGMSAQEWTSLTGLPYVSLTQAQYMTVGEPNPTDLLTAGANAANVRDEAQLAEMNEIDRLARENELAHKEAAEAEAAAWEPSLLEQVMTNHLGPDVTNGLVKAVAESGEITPEMAEKLGLDEEMLADTYQHYEEAADKLLAPVNSCSSYVLNFATETEAKAFRMAMVGRDTDTVRRIGEMTKQRAAAMSYSQLKEYLSPEEIAKVNLRFNNRQPTVTLPGVGEVAWHSAVVNGWVSFT